MQMYTQDSSRSFGSQATYMSQHTRPEIDQQLPSLKDLIPTAAGSESATSEHNGFHSRVVPYLSSQPTTNMMVPTVAAPVPTVGSSAGYGHTLGSSLPVITPSTSPSEYSSPWSAHSQQYGDTPTTVSSQTSLPSHGSGYSSMASSMVSETPEHHQVSYSSGYGPMGKGVSYDNDSPTGDGYKWRGTPLPSTQRYTPYLMSDRSYNQSSPEYSRYGQPSYDQYPRNMPYLESSPYAVRYSQCLNYPIMGYPPNAPGRRRRGNLPKHITDVLRLWLQEHLDHPYPSDEQKQIFIARTGLSISQISNWFINARRRQLPGLKAKRAKAMAGRVQKL